MRGDSKKQKALQHSTQYWHCTMWKRTKSADHDWAHQKKWSLHYYLFVCLKIAFRNKAEVADKRQSQSQWEVVLQKGSLIILTIREAENPLSLLEKDRLKYLYSNPFRELEVYLKTWLLKFFSLVVNLLQDFQIRWREMNFCSSTGRRGTDPISDDAPSRKIFHPFKSNIDSRSRVRIALEFYPSLIS